MRPVRSRIFIDNNIETGVVTRILETQQCGIIFNNACAVAVEEKIKTVSRIRNVFVNDLPGGRVACLGGMRCNNAQEREERKEYRYSLLHNYGF